MHKTSQPLSAKDIKSEEELNSLLESCGISSQSPKDIDWLYPWWLREFGPDLPPARYVEVVGDEKVVSSLCVAIASNKFVIYMFNERDYWFDRLGETDGFASANGLKEYLKKLVEQYLINWKKWLKGYRP